MTTTEAGPPKPSIPAAAGMAAGTTLSRFTGLLRTMALASALGVSVTSDAYNTANTAPTMIFTLVAGGALSAAVVPMLVRAGERRAEVASVLLGGTLVVGTVVSVFVALTAPVLTGLLTAGASGRSDYGEYATLSEAWLRMFAPQVLLYALSVLAVAIMTARRRLALGASAPVATNLLTIAVVLAYMAGTTAQPAAPADVTQAHRLLLGWGTTAAVAAMTAIQLWGAFRSEPGLAIRLAPRHPAMRELSHLGRWMVLYVAVNQLGLAAVIAIANTVPGGITAYQWGFIVMQLPYAIVAVSLLSAALPSIASASDNARRVEAIAAPARLTLAWLVPAAVGLALLSTPLATAVVGRDDRGMVAAAITGFAFSLLPFSLFQLLTRATYALGDTRTPALVNVGVNVVNVVAAVGVTLSTSGSTQTVVGLALSHGLSYVAGCVLLGRWLARCQVLRPRAVGDQVARIVLAAMPVAVGLWAASGSLSRLDTRAAAFGGVALATAASAVLYVAIARALGVELLRANSSGLFPRRHGAGAPVRK